MLRIDRSMILFPEYPLIKPYIPLCHNRTAEIRHCMPPAFFPADPGNFTGSINRTVDGIYQKTGLPVHDQLFHRPSLKSDDRGAAHHGFHYAEPERFFKANAMEQDQGVSQQLVALLRRDISLVNNG